MALRRGLRAAVAASVALAGLHHACGSKSGLPVELGRAPSGAFCESAEYASGGADLGIYIVLDRSLSMEDDAKWSQASAAIGAFVQDPSTAGVAVALSYYPYGSKYCESAAYVLPRVFATNLPEDAPAVLDSLAEQKPEGETPTRPALHGAIQFSRALMLAEPTRRMVVAVVSDGAPNACDSTPVSVAEVAADGLAGTPQVLTFAIGLRHGGVYDLQLLAEEGGTGKPVLVSDGPGAGQELVDALRALREGQTACRFAVPPVPGATPAASDIQVEVRLEAQAGPASAPRANDASGCSSAVHGFYVEGGDTASHAVLCPSLCSLVHQSPGSRVRVIAGCADGLDGGAKPPPVGDAGGCPGAVSIACVTACGTQDHVPPICTGAYWECPPGSVSLETCTGCAPVPHACCLPDGTLVDAPCIDGAWICPPGGTLYGSGDCKAPKVCAATLPCAIGQQCIDASFACGGGPLPGHCAPVPTSCEPGGPAACGCDGVTYGNACEAKKSGTDLAQGVVCPSPPGTFPCGTVFCGVSGELCRHTVTFGGVVPLDDYACVSLPPGCPKGSCCSPCGPCPPGKLCTESCDEDATGGRTLTCNQ